MILVVLELIDPSTHALLKERYFSGPIESQPFQALNHAFEAFRLTFGGSYCSMRYPTFFTAKSTNRRNLIKTKRFQSFWFLSITSNSYLFRLQTHHGNSTRNFAKRKLTLNSRFGFQKYHYIINFCDSAPFDFPQ